MVSLPHEDDWEYACRGGKGNKRPFYWGDSLNGRQANCDGTRPYGAETEGPYLDRTTQVSSYEKEAPHPWGLCDMAGNVWQWCENRYTPGKEGRVVRGGSWYYGAWSCRSARRFGTEPGSCNHNIGFRLAFRLD
jgi:formylglycine-generating enzyme required for sulfatase activity